MRAVIYQRYGPPEVLATSDVPRPVPGEGEVLLRVRATEVTKADCELRAFRFAVRWFWLPMRLLCGVRRPRRRILGSYFAGEVAALGGGVSALRVGDAVFGSLGLRMGGYGEYAVVAAEGAVAPKPANLSFAEAAAVPLGGLNALHFMRLAKVQPGERVLVVGAGGSIGLHAVQIARAMGAEVCAVDKAAKEELARRHGAIDFVDYTRERFADRDARYDVVFDMVPSSRFDDCMRVLKDGGRYFAGNPRLATMVRCLLATRFTRRTASFAFARESREDLLALKAMVEAGELRSIVDEVVPMERIVDAHRKVEAETRMGAIVLTP